MFEVDESACVACNLCIDVCPMEECISMVELAPREMDARTGKVVEEAYANRTTDPSNPTARVLD